MDNKTVIKTTESGLAKLVEELNENRKKRDELMLTRSELGMNTHEDYRTSAYDADLAIINSQIAYLEDVINRVQIISKEHSFDGRIELDDIVTFESLSDGQNRTVQLSGIGPSFGGGGVMKITPNSPLGKCLMGAKVGEFRVYRAGNPEQEFPIRIISKETPLEQSTQGAQPGQE